MGDRVMHIRNNYDLPWQTSDGRDHGLGVFNGDVGFISDIDSRSETLLVRYDERLVYYPFEMLDELEPAYAMTVHKAQGSEYPAVVLVASQAAPQLLNRAVFYTAITRAQSLLVIVGEENVVAGMVNNNRRSKRYSGLKYRMI
jgi:exodeoxyribonuclease V alpha subunit